MRNEKNTINTSSITVKCILQYDPVEENFDVNLHLVCLNKKQEVCDIINYSRSNSAIKYVKSDDSAEEFSLDLSRMGEITDICFVVTILNGLKRNQNLTMIRQISFAISECNVELKFNDLSELSGETALVIGRVYLTNGIWKFEKMQEAYAANLAYQIFL
ncbi:MAG: TerD family protein [Clostridia bacterium]|nr:TerD family protein [Clostridia bacterium]